MVVRHPFNTGGRLDHSTYHATVVHVSSHTYSEGCEQTGIILQKNMYMYKLKVWSQSRNSTYKTYIMYSRQMLMTQLLGQA